MDNNKELLKEILENSANGIEVSIGLEQINSFEIYKELLKEWNKKINLTAITDDYGIAIKHFIDSLTILPYLEDTDKTFIDIGTGAGFPGIPVKIMYNKLNVTLLDSLEKRIKFLNEVINNIGLVNINTVHGRAEDFGTKPEYRECFDYACARAVAQLPVLLEYCMPFVKKEGLFIAMKGSNVEEIALSKKALKVLGGKIEEVKEFQLPNTDFKRNIVVIRKTKETPNQYPRKAGKPLKLPIM